MQLREGIGAVSWLRGGQETGRTDHGTTPEEMSAGGDSGETAGSEMSSSGLAVEEDDPIGHVPDNAPACCPGTQAADAGKATSWEGCPNQVECAAGKGAEIDPDLAGIHDRMADIEYKILISAARGGVGKSTVASQLAMMLSKDAGENSAHCGATRLLDIDICGPSVPRMMGVESSEVRHAAIPKRWMQVMRWKVPAHVTRCNPDSGMNTATRRCTRRTT